MKVIDLLNKIAKGKIQEVKFIKYKNHEYEYYNGDYKEDVGGYDSNWLFANEIIDLTNLNDEVEIIEEDKKIEKSDFQTSQIPPWFRNEELIKVINENFELQTRAIRLLIDVVNKLKEKE